MYTTCFPFTPSHTFVVYVKGHVIWVSSSMDKDYFLNGAKMLLYIDIFLFQNSFCKNTYSRVEETFVKRETEHSYKWEAGTSGCNY